MKVGVVVCGSLLVVGVVVWVIGLRWDTASPPLMSIGRSLEASRKESSSTIEENRAFGSFSMARAMTAAKRSGISGVTELNQGG
jgi:hypothetical protein